MQQDPEGVTFLSLLFASTRGYRKTKSRRDAGGTSKPQRDFRCGRR